MNRTVRNLALLAALALATTACQKDNEMLPLNSTEQTSETIQVVYAINGEVYQTTLNESEWDAFIERMLALAREGYEVTFSRNTSSLASQSKEKFIYVTNNKQEAYAWAHNMSNQGYIVTITYDETTGEFTCIAVK